MSTLLVYLSGLITPFIVLLAVNAPLVFADWRHDRRYRKAWKKFGEEFASLSDQHLAACRVRWAEQPYKYQSVCDDRSKYFVMRWNNGFTKEI